MYKLDVQAFIRSFICRFIPSANQYLKDYQLPENLRARLWVQSPALLLTGYGPWDSYIAILCLNSSPVKWVRWHGFTQDRGIVRGI